MRYRVHGGLLESRVTESANGEQVVSGVPGLD